MKRKTALILCLTFLLSFFSQAWASSDIFTIPSPAQCAPTSHCHEMMNMEMEMLNMDYQDQSNHKMECCDQFSGDNCHNDCLQLTKVLPLLSLNFFQQTVTRIQFVAIKSSPLKAIYPSIKPPISLITA
ncbi:hypothetical protein L0B53_18800 (plasmid) [Vibrio sp. SS-MA-C1-2]|uniref:hypothetical protein n=1 Tax=Vibrio sp. SS-MA-C1-2 TaxID=2908646 RepID=UPI001F2175C1|nr:hypothetical protein [Vibrio sp. SS-MA-C1-2]UJF20188.1 hypothetical protein L0B53_18800 [Vibrio sp. SS-MA-C1-2]